MNDKGEEKETTTRRKDEEKRGPWDDESRSLLEPQNTVIGSFYTPSDNHRGDVSAVFGVLFLPHPFQNIVLETQYVPRKTGLKSRSFLLNWVDRGPSMSDLRCQ